MAVDYGWFATDVRSLAARLAAQVERVCDRTGFDRVHIVAHSMGGLVARYYVQRLGGHERVHTLVTLGTPQRGTRWARALPPSGGPGNCGQAAVPRRTGGAEPSVRYPFLVVGATWTR